MCQHIIFRQTFFGINILHYVGVVFRGSRGLEMVGFGVWVEDFRGRGV